jgi:hypothetical protein
MSDIKQKLGDLIRERYLSRMEGEPEIAGDTLLVRFDSGLTLELQPAADSDFTYSWAWSAPDWGLETDIMGWDYALYREGEPQEEQETAVRGRITQPANANWPDLRAVLDAMFSQPNLAQAI